MNRRTAPRDPTTAEYLRIFQDGGSWWCVTYAPRDRLVEWYRSEDQRGPWLLDGLGRWAGTCVVSQIVTPPWLNAKMRAILDSA